jgi:dihydroneopterin aldolase
MDFTKYRKLFLNYETTMHIGVYEREKINKQRISIKIEVYVPLQKSVDSIDQVVNYDFLHNIVQSHIHLQETLCDTILDSLLQNPQVCIAKVCIEKLDIYTNASVGVEAYRFK